MDVTFDFRPEQSGLFGTIHRPVARVVLTGENKREFPEIFYVDSGADVTLIPLSVGELLGFKIEASAEITEIKGIGERGVPIVLKQVMMRINGREFPAKVAWCLIEEVPLLLGREDVFRLFDIAFLRNRKTVFKH